jgi:hypothetical protein
LSRGTIKYNKKSYTTNFLTQKTDQAKSRVSASKTPLFTPKLIKSGEKVKAMAKVVREAKEVSTQLNAYGLCFTEISERDRERIRKFIFEQSS